MLYVFLNFISKYIFLHEKTESYLTSLLVHWVKKFSAPNISNFISTPLFFSAGTFWGSSLSVWHDS